MDATDYAATQSRLRQALATHDEDYLKRNYPGAWPWPVSPVWPHPGAKAPMNHSDLDEAGMPMLVEGENR